MQHSPFPAAHLKHLAAPLLCGLLFSSCQSTDAPLVGTKDHYAEADANKDGKLTLDEVNTMLVSEVFEARDANNDGHLVMSEWVVGNDPAQKTAFRKRDINHDKMVTLQEALAFGKEDGAAAKLFDAADRNGNKSLSRKEVLAYYGAREAKPR